ncbi:hypothetical protein HA402_009028 [Bradysia odoriphaga]|nr:hypothetical protein HA402_009028 [Bradysia odoriphaga]
MVTMKVRWDRKGQTMEGFGVFAGREQPFAESKYRDKIIERLFSLDGLGLTILRGQLYPNLDCLTCTFPPDEARAEAQMILLKEIKATYNIDKVILSSWSPPYNWKTFEDVPFGRVGCSFNKLTHTKYDDFAQYIVTYIEYCKHNGIDIYAISPQNEPEFPTDLWEGCVWSPANLVHFLDKLKPLLETKGLNVQIMAGETANWKIAGWYLYMMRRSMKDPYKQVDIVASHGYSLPQLGNLMVTYETSPGSWFLSRKFKRRWITEASCTMCFDGSMTTAIKLATSLHHFIANNNVSAFIYWLAMVDHYSNEALIFEDKDRDKLFYPKAFYIFGQFTKWVRPDMIRIDLTKKFFKYDSTGTMASIYLNEKTNEFTLVVINPHKSKQSTFQLDFNGAQIQNETTLAGYKTSDQYDWEVMSVDEIVLKSDGSHLTLINEPYSVKTITGKLVF